MPKKKGVDRGHGGGVAEHFFGFCVNVEKSETSTILIDRNYVHETHGLIHVRIPYGHTLPSEGYKSTRPHKFNTSTDSFEMFRSYNFYVDVALQVLHEAIVQKWEEISKNNDMKDPILRRLMDQ